MEKDEDLNDNYSHTRLANSKLGGARAKQIVSTSAYGPPQNCQGTGSLAITNIWA